jgi:hypothetical protein
MVNFYSGLRTRNRGKRIAPQARWVAQISQRTGKILDGENLMAQTWKEPSKTELHLLQLIAAVDNKSVAELGKTLIESGEFSSIPEIPRETQPSRFVIRPTNQKK